MEQYLVHHGIKGQKWGVRRYQNEDGTLTEEGRAKRNKQYVKDVTKVGKRAGGAVAGIAAGAKLATNPVVQTAITLGRNTPVIPALKAAIDGASYLAGGNLLASAIGKLWLTTPLDLATIGVGVPIVGGLLAAGAGALLVGSIAKGVAKAKVNREQ